jgi:diguanylate cyclase (GGDEF)-like protein
VDGEGSVWIGTRKAGLARLDPGTGTVTSFRHREGDESSLGDDTVFVIEPARDGGLWLGTDRGIDRLDPRRRQFAHFGRGGEGRALADLRVRALHEDSHGLLWIGTYGGGLSRLDPRSGAVTTFRHDPAAPQSLPHDRVRALHEDTDGRLWVGTAGALALFDVRAGTFHTYRNDRGDPGSLSDDDVLALFQDRGGVLWVGTRSGGLNRWHPHSWTFGHHAPGAGGLADGTVTSFAQNGAGTLWIGTLGGGLHRLDRDSGAMEYFRNEPANPRSLSSDRVSALLVDSAGRLWVGTLDRGLNRLAADGRSFEHYQHDPADPRTLGADGVTTLLEDDRGQLWIGTFGGGLHRYQPDTDSFTRFAADPAVETSLSSPRVTSLAEDSFGALWVGTDGGGLNRFDPATGRFRRVRYHASEPGSAATETVFALHAERNGVLWVGSRGGGLFRLQLRPQRPAEPEIRRFTRRDGLPNEVIYGIEPDDQGRLWLATNNGLAVLDPRDGAVRNWEVSHGLQANEFTFGAHYRGHSGELFFGGINGFNAFLPHRVRHSEAPPSLQVTRILKLNRPATELGPAWALQRLDLGHRDDVVTFELAALDFAAPERNRYAYRLEGFDAGWVELGHHRRVTYTDLDAGSYVFQARAANHDGVWSQQPVSLLVEVAPAPWRSWWAYGAYAVLAALGLFGLVRVQRRRLAQEEAYSHRLEQEVRERTEELAVRNHDLERLNQELAEASLTDSLTGLRNRRFLFEVIDQEVALVTRRYIRLGDGVEPIRRFDLVFVMIDLDHFKGINDTCGHQAGDQVLVQVRQVLESICRTSDLLIRWGGDELLVVARDSSAEEAETLALRIVEAVRAHVFTVDHGRVVRTTCSIGYACFPFLRKNPRAFTWEEVLGLADAALYAVKKSGRDGWAGVVANDSTPTELLQLLRHQPQRVVGEGLVTIRTSFARAAELVWA